MDNDNRQGSNMHLDSLPSPGIHNTYRSGTPQSQQLSSYNHIPSNANLNNDSVKHSNNNSGGGVGGDGFNPILMESEDHMPGTMQRNASLTIKTSHSDHQQPSHFYQAQASRAMNLQPNFHQSQNALYSAGGGGYVQTANGEIIQLQPPSHYGQVANQTAPMIATSHNIGGPHSVVNYEPNELIYQQHGVPPGYVAIPRHPTQLTYDSCPAICSLFAIFCCPITLWCTVPALVYSICAYTDFKAEDWYRYRRKSDRARRLVIAACITGLLMCIGFSIILYFYYDRISDFSVRFVSAASNIRTTN